MSLKKNILSNYCGTFYNILISIAIVPLYIRYLGIAAYGLIGLYALIQSWLYLLNMGLSPALSREIAFCRNQPNEFIKIRELLRSLEIIFLIVSLLVVVVIMVGSNWIAHHWLKVSNLSYNDVEQCISIMSVIIGCRFFSDLYREGVCGMEKQVSLNGINIILTTLRYGGAYVLLRYITRTPIHFFEYQLLIAAIEPILLGKQLYRTLPPSRGFFNFNTSCTLIRKIFPFASGLFYSAMIYVLLTQSDKLILSHILSLTNFGYFSLVVVISGGMLQCVMPIYSAILPRMTALLAQNKKKEMLQLYRNTTQLIIVIMFPLIGITAIFNAPIVYIWTGNSLAANWTGPILFWYVLGNGFSILTTFEFYMQFAFGSVKLQVIFDTFFAIVYFPSILFSAYHYGAKGTAITWFVMQGLLFFILPAIVHRKYAPGMHRKWLLEDIFPIFLAGLLALLLVRKIPINFELLSRSEGFLIVSGFIFFVFVICAFTSSTCRSLFATLITRKKIREYLVKNN